MGDAFRSKLARLRRDVERRGGVTAPPAHAAAGLPASLRARLAARGSVAASDVSRNLRAPLPDEPHGLEVVERKEGAFAVKEIRVPLAGARHGTWGLDEIDAVCGSTIARLTRDPALEGLDLKRALFLDTETSGLSGGAGVYVYMVGLGWYEDDAFVTWQSFLRHPGEEAAMLAEVAERLTAASGMVSFFGKSFDRHRLEDKMRIAGITPPFEGLPHLDLYHPFRRLTHGAFENGRLQTMEKELLEFHRVDDLPGSLAPAAWFDYLAGRPHRLEGVFEHNHHDVLSLAALAAYLGRAETEERASGDELRGPAARRAVALSETAPDRTEELLWAERALEREVAGDDRRKIQLRRADLLRRANRVDDARAAYKSALEECTDDRFAVELFTGASMLMERAVRDLEHAHAFADRAVDVARRTGATQRRLESLQARVDRLAQRRVSSRR